MNFQPHRYCLLNDDVLIMLMNIGNVAIALSYYVIPFGLIYTLRRLPIGFSRSAKILFFGYAAFIFSCGTTHVMDVVTIYYSAYWLQCCVILLTALVSIPMAYLTIKHLPSRLK